MIKILHVASFNGNVGDNANHNGLRSLLKRQFDDELSYTELEIRKFYQNYSRADKLRFDESFAKLANEHDMVIIGGGNFFEIWIDSSSTGTTIDMAPHIVDMIETPIFFFGLGFDPYKGAPKANIEKFKRFVDQIYAAKIHTITVRNDGSAKHVRNLLGEEYTKKIEPIPDGGFFIEESSLYKDPLKLKKSYIAVNIAKDMSDLRFNPADNGIDYKTFISELAGVLEDFLSRNEDMELLLIPHIYSDLDAIYDLMAEMEDLYRRNRITVAPLLHGEGSEKTIFSLYKEAVFAMGMRFHTNACSIGLNTPTIALCTYPNLYDLYEELDLLDQIVIVNRPGFQKNLAKQMQNSMKNVASIKKRYLEIRQRLEQQAESILGKTVKKL